LKEVVVTYFKVLFPILSRWSEGNHRRDVKAKSEGKRPLGKPRSRWEVNIRIDIGETVRRCELDSSGSG